MYIRFVDLIDHVFFDKYFLGLGGRVIQIRQSFKIMESQAQDGANSVPSASHPGNQPDVYVKCPYFPEHELRRSRMPYHIMKCQNNPRAPKLLACPYNYLHRVRPEDQSQHLEICEDKVIKRYSERGTPSYSKTLKSRYKDRMKYQRDPDTPTDDVPVETNESDWW